MWLTFPWDNFKKYTTNEVKQLHGDLIHNNHVHYHSHLTLWCNGWFGSQMCPTCTPSRNKNLWKLLEINKVRFKWHRFHFEQVQSQSMRGLRVIGVMHKNADGQKCGWTDGFSVLGVVVRGASWHKFLKGEYLYMDVFRSFDMSIDSINISHFLYVLYFLCSFYNCLPDSAINHCDLK